MLRRARRELGVAATAAAAVLGTSVGDAQAGTYRVNTCRLSTGAPAPTDGWQGLDSASSINVDDGCAGGGALVVRADAAGWNSSFAIGWTWHAPPDTSVKGVELYRDFALGSANGTSASPLEVLADESRILEQHGTASAPAGDGVSRLGRADAPLSQDNRVTLGALGGNLLRVTLRCGGYPSAFCPNEPGKDLGVIRVHRALFTLQDDSAPSPGTVAGGLAATGVHRGTQSLTVNATDTGSGVYRGIVEVDGQPVLTQVLDDNEGRCADAGTDPADDYEFVHTVPCRLGVSAPLTLDTTKIADGEHQLTVRVEDAAGNRATALGPQVFTVDNIDPPTQTSAPEITGTAREGDALAVDQGGWDGHGEALSFRYGWQRSADGTTWSDVSGARKSAYTAAEEDIGKQLRACVTATSSQGSTTACSAPTGRVAAPPAPDAGTVRPSAPKGGDTVAAPPAPAPGAPHALNSSDGRSGVAISARLLGSRSERRSVTAPYGKRIPLVGVLRDADGRPVAGARIEVLEQVRTAGAPMRAVGSAVTDANGTFRYVAPAGPSRLVRFAYRRYRDDAQFAFVRDVVVRVRAGLSLKVSPRHTRNHHRITFTGRLRGTRSAKVVELQVRKGRSWQTFTTVRARHGRFRAHYRFQRTYWTTTYRFRARVRAERGFPYLTAATPSRSVRVRP